MTTSTHAPPPTRHPAPPKPSVRLLAIVGPSGAGKSSVIRHLAEGGILRVHPTWTTRPRRPEERDGALEHRFVDDDEFDLAVHSGTFLATATMFGLPYRYGLPALSLASSGPIDTIMLRSTLVPQAKSFFGQPVVYAFTACATTTSARLAARGVTGTELECRQRANLTELPHAKQMAWRIFDTSGPARGGIPAMARAVARALAADFTGTWDDELVATCPTRGR